VTGERRHADDVASREAYIEPAIGFDMLRDAVALLRCVARDDHEGLHAIVTGTSQPRNLAGATAMIALEVMRRCGIGPSLAEALLAEISRNASDSLLDQPRPGRGNREVM
jgi:hypothetical protein